LKTCITCKEQKSFDSFYKKSAAPDGLACTCKECKYIYDKSYRELNRDKIRENQKRWEAANREHCNSKYREYAEKNRERRRELVMISIRKKPWKKNAREAKRRSAKLNATPMWANMDMISDIYETCPKGYHVDHIVPLQGKTVCGLHVEYNLQHLLAYDNFIKSNKF